MLSKNYCKGGVMRMGHCVTYITVRCFFVKMQPLKKIKATDVIGSLPLKKQVYQKRTFNPTIASLDKRNRILQIFGCLSWL